MKWKATKSLPAYTETQIWDSRWDGTAKRSRNKHGGIVYVPLILPKKKSGTRKLTEAEDNAIGRAVRRRQNRRLRGWLPHAQR